MDVLEALLAGPRARGAHVLQVIMSPPWSIRVQDTAPLALVALVHGEAWITTDDGESTRMVAGDIAVFRGPEPYLLAHRADAAPTVIVHPGNVCETVDGEPLVDALALGVRTWGSAVDGAGEEVARMLIGTYHAEGAVSRRLLDRLPPVLLHRAVGRDAALLDLLGEEVPRDAPGQAAVLDRLLDLLLISVLRTWLEGEATASSSWCAGLGDPVVSRVLNLIHHNPAEPWTVASLASGAGVSRAALSRRFGELVGEPPISYLTGWRLDLAADLLADRDLTIEAIARRVGYSSAFAFSTAFKRGRGVSPSRHRATLEPVG